MVASVETNIVKLQDQVAAVVLKLEDPTFVEVKKLKSEKIIMNVISFFLFIRHISNIEIPVNYSHAHYFINSLTISLHLRIPTSLSHSPTISLPLTHPQVDLIGDPNKVLEDLYLLGQRLESADQLAKTYSGYQKMFGVSESVVGYCNDYCV